MTSRRHGFDLYAKHYKTLKITNYLQPGNWSSVKVLNCPSPVTTPMVFYIKAEKSSIHRIESKPLLIIMGKIAAAIETDIMVSVKHKPLKTILLVSFKEERTGAENLGSRVTDITVRSWNRNNDARKELARTKIENKNSELEWGFTISDNKYQLQGSKECLKVMSNALKD